MSAQPALFSTKTPFLHSLPQIYFHSHGRFGPFGRHVTESVTIRNAKMLHVIQVTGPLSMAEAVFKGLSMSKRMFLPRLRSLFPVTSNNAPSRRTVQQPCDGSLFLEPSESVPTSVNCVFLTSSWRARRYSELPNLTDPVRSD